MPYPRAPYFKSAFVLAWILVLAGPNLALASPKSAAASNDSLPLPPYPPPPTVRGTLTLDQAVQLALHYNPDLAAAAWHARGAAQHVRDQSRPLNPTLEGTEENFGGDLGGRIAESTISATQMLELGGERGARKRVATEEMRVAEAELQIREREVVVEAGEAFLKAWLLEQRIENLVRAEKIAEATISDARERTRIGAAPPVEGLRAQTVLAQRTIDRRGAEAELAAARRELALEWGATEAEFDSLALPPADIPPIPPPDSLLIDLERHPERLRAAAATAVEEARVHGARAARVPDLSLHGGVRRLQEVGGTGFVAGVSFELPLWNTGGSFLRSAEAERSAATSREQLVRRRLEQQLKTAYDSLMAAKDAEEMARSRLLPAARQALAELQKGYRAGRFTYLDQLDGQRAALDAELTAAGTIRQTWSARLALEQLLGLTLEEAAARRER